MMGLEVDSNAFQGTVLIVDDEASVVRALTRYLKRQQYTIVGTTSALEALEHVRAGGVDVVVSDISMPGMWGIDLLRAIREHEPDLPVVLVTGLPALESATKAIEYGALKYIVKPVDPDALCGTVQRAVRLNRFARSKRQALLLQGRSGEASDRAGLEAGFDRALKTLWMAFQPIVQVSDRSLFGYEALLRSEEPALPGPSQVLDAAERLGCLPQLGEIVRERAGRAMRDSNVPGALFVNLHPDDLLEPDFSRSGAGLSQIAERVVFEITERAALGSVERVRERVKELRAQGFRIAIDDLGAGFAGLSSFATLEPDIVKIDMTLVRNIDTDATKQKVVSTMTALSHDMGMLMVAEGVETREERDALAEVGCDLLQGYLFARPGPPFPGISWG